MNQKSIFYLFDCLAIILAIISNSIFIQSQSFAFPRFVQFWVRGMSETEKNSSWVSTRVRLVPLRVILPFSIRRWEYFLSKCIQRIIDPSFFFSESHTFHTVSICPVTKCPSSLSHIWRHRSTLNTYPILFSPKFVTRKLSSIAKNS